MAYRLTKEALREAMREAIYGDADPPYIKDTNRLISSISPTGKIIFQDAFEVNTLKWLQRGAGTMALSTESPFGGNAALRLTTFAPAGSAAGARRNVSWLRSNRIGWEAWFCFGEVDPIGISGIYFNIYYRDLVNTDEYTFRYRPGTQEWQVRTLAGYETVFTAEAINDLTWHHVKMCVDTEARRYISVEAMDQIAYPTDKDPQVFADGLTPRAYTFALQVITEGGIRYADFDDVVATMEEP